jgi:predicted TIM-barrel fold metal-dependent hydrolase
LQWRSIGRNYGEYLTFFYDALSKQVGHDIPAQLLDLGEERLRYMDQSGIDVQVLSITAPGPQGFGKEIAIAFARDANNRLCEVVEQHPARFAGFAALPTADPEAAARELERAVKHLDFKGAMIHGHQQGSFLDDKKYWCMFDCAAKLEVPTYLHPTVPHPDVTRAYFGDYEELAGAAWGFAIDTSCHFLRLMFSGLFDAYPLLKIILGHLGEGLPFAMHRLHDKTYQAAAHRGLKKTPLRYIKDNLLVTTSGNWYEPAFVCALLALGADNVL